MPKKDNSVGFAVRQFVPYGQDVDLGFILNVPKCKGCRLDSFKVTINKCVDDENVVILFFNVDGESF